MKLKNRIRKAYYRLVHSHGDRYCCVFCGQSYSRFISTGVKRSLLKKLDVVGAGRRRDAKCPNCFSTDRARLILLYLKTRTNTFERPTRVLHIAPDPHLARALFRAETVDYVCGGLQAEGMAAYGPVFFDVISLPFRENHFDMVLCNHVMEYVADDALGFREIHRVLKPGGSAILQVPIALALDETLEHPGLEMTRKKTIKLYGQSYNRRIYGRDYPERVQKAGFRIRSHRAVEERWVYDIERNGLDPREALYIFIKERDPSREESAVR